MVRKGRKQAIPTTEAAAAAAAPPSVSAQVVGNAFVRQYYRALHHTPGLACRFYRDISMLGRPEEDGSMSITTTVQAINEKIVSLEYGDFRAEIKSVDAQESFNGGVHVLVTGYLTGKDKKVSNFAQTFFLAPQDRGYFVLNDMFRYVNNVALDPRSVSDVVMPIAAEPVPVPVQENHVSEEMKKRKKKKEKQSMLSAEEAVSEEVYNPLPALVSDVVMPIAAEPVPVPVQENHVSEEREKKKKKKEKQSMPSAEEAVSREVYNPLSALVSDVVMPIAAEPVPVLVRENHVSEEREKKKKKKEKQSMPSAEEAVSEEVYNPFPALVSDVVVPIAAEAVPVPVQVNHVSEERKRRTRRKKKQSMPSAEEAVLEEVDNPPVNGDVLIPEEVPVAYVVDEVQDDAELVFESHAKNYEKFHASIVADGTSDSTSHSSDIELLDNVQYARNLSRNNLETSESSGSHRSTEKRNIESELPQKVLESLFNMPTPMAAEHEPHTVNWRNVLKKMTSLGQGFENGDSEQGQLIHAKGDEYQVLREAAHQHRDSMESYVQKAATVFTNVEKAHESYLSEQGRLQSEMAREADEKASWDIFTKKNKNMKNVITFDLHGQHVKQAMELLKLHLLFGAYLRSVKSFRVITGRGKHCAGKSKLKDSVINLLQREGIPWSEENPGALLIRLDGWTNFSFRLSVSDMD